MAHLRCYWHPGLVLLAQVNGHSKAGRSKAVNAKTPGLVSPPPTARQLAGQRPPLDGDVLQGLVAEHMVARAPLLPLDVRDMALAYTI